jgi:hypothetical protein
MKRGRRLKAMFSDGKVDHLTTEKGFTHAWRVTGLKGARFEETIGWARSEPLAKMAAGSHTRSAAKHWTDVTAEVVEVEALP